MNAANQSSSPSIIFMGTPAFAVPTLEALHRSFGLRAVVTKPDRPKGRGLQLQPPPVKVAAQKLGIAPILQPERLKDPSFQQHIAALRPDIIAVVAFRILPPSIYTLARKGAFNVHPSLLPAYRGAAPIPWTIICGEKETGVTSFLLQETVDTGPILLQKSIRIPEGCTAGELHDLLAPLAAEIAVETTRLLLEGNAKPQPQPPGNYPVAPKIRPEQYWIRWELPALQVCRWIRGLSPHPGARTLWNANLLKIFQCAVVEPPHQLLPAHFRITEHAFLVGCGSGTAIRILALQLPGKKRLNVEQFLRGYRGKSEGKFDAPLG